MKINTNPVRGTEDYGPQDMVVRESVRETILKTYKQFGFLQIKTPIIEDINLLLGSDAGDNSKLMYKVLKRGEKLDLTKENLSQLDLVDLGLRYDLTVPLVRFFCNNQANLSMPFKAIQIDDVFRADRPQRGRSRQFCQCDIDIIGDTKKSAEVELLYVAGITLSRLGFKKFVFKINDKRILDSLITSSGFDSEAVFDVCVTLDKLNKIGLDGIKAELGEKGYDNVIVETLLNNLDKVAKEGLNSLKSVNEEAVADLTYIIENVNKLSEGNYTVEFDISIIRGQSYYTSTVYEVYCEGFRGACGAGGRYDKMVERISGMDYPAVGFSIGFEPVCMLLKEQGKTVEGEGVVIFCEKDDNIAEVLLSEKEFENYSRVTYAYKAKNFNFQKQKMKAMGFTKYCFFDNREIRDLWL